MRPISRRPGTTPATIRAHPWPPVVVVAALSITASLALAACGTLTRPQVQQLKIEAASRAFTSDVRRYEQVEPSVTVPLTLPSWHQQWLKPRPEFIHLLDSYYRWHFASWRVLARTGDAQTRSAENAYRFAIGRWVGDQLGKFTMIQFCVGDGPFVVHDLACWSSELRLHRARWLEDDVALRLAFAGMSGKMTRDYPVVLPRPGWIAG